MLKFAVSGRKIWGDLSWTVVRSWRRGGGGGVGLLWLAGGEWLADEAVVIGDEEE